MTARLLPGAPVAEAVLADLRPRIAALVEAGHQPFTDESGEVVGMQNGELYNHEQIRRDLEAAGHVLHTRCDTEILPHLYERDGDKEYVHTGGADTDYQALGYRCTRCARPVTLPENVTEEWI